MQTALRRRPPQEDDGADTERMRNCAPRAISIMFWALAHAHSVYAAPLRFVCMAQADSSRLCALKVRVPALSVQPGAAPPASGTGGSASPGPATRCRRWRR